MGKIKQQLNIFNKDTTRVLESAFNRFKSVQGSELEPYEIPILWVGIDLTGSGLELQLNNYHKQLNFNCYSGNKIVGYQPDDNVLTSFETFKDDFKNFVETEFIKDL